MGIARFSYFCRIDRLVFNGKAFLKVSKGILKLNVIVVGLTFDIHKSLLFKPDALYNFL